MARRHRQTGKRDSPQLQPAAPSLLAEQPPLPGVQSPQPVAGGGGGAAAQPRHHGPTRMGEGASELLLPVPRQIRQTTRLTLPEQHPSSSTTLLQVSSWKRRGLSVHTRNTGPAQGRGSPARRRNPAKPGGPQSSL